MEPSGKKSEPGKRQAKRGKGKRFKKDKDDVCRILEDKIGLSNEELQASYAEFMELCPQGEMTKVQFLEVAKDKVQDKQGGALFAESLFRVFDEDGNGKMNFYEFSLAINCKNFTEPKEKLTWIFNVFDADGGGVIDLDEIIKLVIGLVHMSDVEADREVLLACVQDILEAVDENNDGEISRAEFVENAMRSGFIRNLIGE